LSRAYTIASFIYVFLEWLTGGPTSRLEKEYNEQFKAAKMDAMKPASHSKSMLQHDNGMFDQQLAGMVNRKHMSAVENDANNY
jgi:hypothetical protein